MPKISTKFDGVTPYANTGRQMQVGYAKIVHFRQLTCCNSKTVQNKCKVSIKVKYESYVLY